MEKTQFFETMAVVAVRSSIKVIDAQRKESLLPVLPARANPEPALPRTTWFPRRKVQVHECARRNGASLRNRWQFE